MGKIWDTEEEAARLAARFKGVNQAEFARKFDLPGGASMLSQHIKGRRPMNMDAALVYMKGFGVRLDEISPRLAKQMYGTLRELEEARLAQASGSPDEPAVAESSPEPVSLPPVRAITISGNLDTPEGRLLARLLLAAKLPGVNVEVKTWNSGDQSPQERRVGKLGETGRAAAAKSAAKKNRDER